MLCYIFLIPMRIFEISSALTQSHVHCFDQIVPISDKKEGILVPWRMNI